MRTGSKVEEKTKMCKHLHRKNILFELARSKNTNNILIVLNRSSLKASNIKHSVLAYEICEEEKMWKRIKF